MTDRHLAVTFSPRPGDGELTGQVVRLNVIGASAEGLHGTLAL
jgi:hypothetical protein